MEYLLRDAQGRVRANVHWFRNLDDGTNVELKFISDTAKGEPMVITCRFDDAGNLPESWLEPRAGLGPETTFPLTVDGRYVVYGLATRGTQVWFFISDDDRLYYPKAYPAPLFELSDGRVSSSWHFRLTPGHQDHDAIFAIREWAMDDFFYDRLTDGNVAEVRLFAEARQRLEQEALGA